jgi:Tol biopolymer transport system component/C-terminal processing protease CtpA/Prc
MIRRFLPVLVLLFAFTITFAEPPLWLRYPAISPDGQAIVFAYRGDLYRVPAEGGRAVLLTVYGGHDFMPVFSRDGQWIAFASDRHGNFDVFLMPAAGGEARRLTYHSADDYPSDFTPGDQAVLFSSARLDAVTSAQFPTDALPELYRAPLQGGRVTQVLTTPAQAARYIGDGEAFVYHDQKGYENQWRKHHTSSVTRDLWLYDGDGGHRRLTTFAGEDRNPVVVGDALYYLSEETGSFNVHRTTLEDPSRNEPVTSFRNHPVRFLSAARDSTLCFGFDGEIYTLAPGGRPTVVPIEIRTDRHRPDRELLPISGNITEMSLSPEGKEIALVVRGEVFVASVAEGTTRRITDTPEQERSVSWSPDGRSILYAAERDGSWQIYRTSLARESESYFFQATLLDEEAILTSREETFQPRYSPTGKEVAFLENRTTLRVLDLETKKTRTVVPGDMSFSYADGDQHYERSPDGRWFLVEFLQPGIWSPEVGLVRADGSGEVLNTTQSGFGDFGPRWMMGGKMMLWFSERDGMRGQARTGSRQVDAYAQFLTREAWDRFRLSKEEFELLEEAEDEADGEDEGEEEDAAAAGKDKGDKKARNETEDEIEPLEIELDGLRDRRARLTIHSSRLADAVVTPDGKKLLYLARFEKGYDLWSTDLRTRETKILAKLGSQGGSLEMDEEGKKVFVLAGGALSKVEVESGKRTPLGLKGGEMWVDQEAEFAYFFEHAWRQVKEKFYDRDLHGADWDFYKKAYVRFLPHIDNGRDFAEMLSEMLGELNASHTGARYRGRPPAGDDTASLGLFFDPSHQGAGLLVAEVMPRSPVLNADGKIRAGVVIEKIDGTAIEPDTSVPPLLNRKAGRNVLLSLLDPESGERWEEVVKPVSRGQEAQLRYRRWVESRRKLTEELSGGRIGYVHVRSMSDSSYRTVYEEVLGRHATAEAVVVDTRFNGGGDLVDDLSIFLSGKKYMEFVPPDGRVIGVEPGARWTRPSVVVMSEGNYSDAHCFPWAYDELGIGKTVGMPVAGTCTFVWWETLHNREINFGIPNMAVASNDGRPLENRELEPDLEVENHVSIVSRGRDQQLERAVELLLEELGSR